MEALIKKYGRTLPPRNSYFQLGRSFLESGDYSLAEESFVKASKLKGKLPLEWELNVFLGETYEKLAYPVKAVICYLRALKNDIGDYAKLFDRIFGLLEDANTARSVMQWIAENDYHFELKPEDEQFEMEMKILFGTLDLKVSDLESARDNFESIPDDAPKRYRIKALISLSEIEFLENNFEDSRLDVEQASRLIERIEEYPKLLLQYTRLFLALGQKDNAKLVFEGTKPLLEEAGLQNDLVLDVAHYFMKVAEWEQALYLVELINAWDINEQGYIVKLECLLALKRYSEAKKQAENAFREYPIRPRITMLRIQTLIESQFDIMGGVKLFYKVFPGNQKGVQSDVKNKDKSILKHTEIESELKLSDEQIKVVEGDLERSYRRREQDNNAKFYLAFIYVLLQKEGERIEKLLETVRKEGLQGDTDKKEKNEYRFKALDILDGYHLELKEQDKEAANKFHAGAKAYYWEGHYQTTIDYCKKSIDLDSTNYEVYWHLSDTYRLLSRIKEPPYNDPYYVDLAYKAWSGQPKGLTLEKKEQYWGYLVGSRIHDLKYYFAETEFLQEIWKSILYAERAIVHKKDNAVAWTDLGKCYDNIGLYHTSYQALTKAKELNAEDTYALEEYTKVLLNLYEFDEAKEWISILSEKLDYPYLAWKGFIEYIGGNYNEAIKFINDYLKGTPLDAWTLGIKMECHWLLKDFKEAKNTAIQVLELSKNKDIKRQEDTYARAAFINGETSKAIDISLDTCRKSGHPYFTEGSLSLFYLYENKLSKAGDQFDHFLKSEWRKEALDLMVRKLGLLKQMAKSEKLAHLEALTANIGNSKAGWIKELRNQIKINNKRKIRPDDELKHVLEHNKHKPGTIPWIVLKAGLARLKWENKNYFQAYQQYRELTGYSEDFPDVQVAMEEIFHEIIEENKQRLKRSEFDSVIKELKDEAIEVPEVTTLLILAYLGKNKRKEAETHFIDYLQKSSNSEDPVVSDNFSRALLDSIPNNQLFWDLDDLIGSCKKRLDKSAFFPLIERIINSLNDYWVVQLGAGQSANMLPVVTPIAIEVSKDLIQEGPESEWTLIKEFMPKLRDDLKQQYNVKVPGIRIRGNETDLPEGTYIIMIDEIPIVSGNVRKDALFVPGQLKELRKLKLTLSEIEYPFEGAWVEKKHLPLLKEKEIEWWDDPFRYIIDHLRLQLLQRLDYFYDIQYTNDYLNEVDELPQEVQQVAQVVRTDDKLLRLFDKVLRGLLSEQVPVNNKHVLIENFEAIDAKLGYDQLIQKIRLNLKQILPGNNPNLKRIKLPDLLEQKIHDELKSDKHKVFLAMEPKICQEILNDIRELVADYKLRDIVLEVNNTKLRPFVRELIRSEFKDLMVIAKEEVSEITTLNSLK